jgi:hypothetical protein
MNVHLDDETLSATIDGYSSAEERAHLDRCAICSQRLERLKEVSRLVGARVPSPPRAVADAAVAAAMAFRQPGEIPVGSLPVSHLKRRRLQPLLAAAALVIVVGAGVVAIARATGPSGSSKRAASAQRAGSPAPAASSTTAPGLNLGGAAAGASSTGTPVDLGDFSDTAALTTALRQRASQSVDRRPASSPQTAPCQPLAATAAGVPSTSIPNLVAALRWRGQPATSFVYQRGGSAGPVAVVMANQGCGQLIVLPL